MPKVFNAVGDTTSQNCFCFSICPDRTLLESLTFIKISKKEWKSSLYWLKTTTTTTTTYPWQLNDRGCLYIDSTHFISVLLFWSHLSRLFIPIFRCVSRFHSVWNQITWFTRRLYLKSDLPESLPIFDCFIINLLISNHLKSQ